jgi:hypothetical protein
MFNAVTIDECRSNGPCHRLAFPAGELSSSHSMTRRAFIGGIGSWSQTARQPHSRNALNLRLRAR